jgi:hypothetical protein
MNPDVSNPTEIATQCMATDGPRDTPFEASAAEILRFCKDGELMPIVNSVVDLEVHKLMQSSEPHQKVWNAMHEHIMRRAPQADESERLR